MHARHFAKQLRSLVSLEAKLMTEITQLRQLVEVLQQQSAAKTERLQKQEERMALQEDRMARQEERILNMRLADRNIQSIESDDAFSDSSDCTSATADDSSEEEEEDVMEINPPPYGWSRLP